MKKDRRSGCTVRCFIDDLGRVEWFVAYLIIKNKQTKK